MRRRIVFLLDALSRAVYVAWAAQFNASRPHSEHRTSKSRSAIGAVFRIRMPPHRHICRHGAGHGNSKIIPAMLEPLATVKVAQTEVLTRGRPTAPGR